MFHKNKKLELLVKYLIVIKHRPNENYYLFNDNEKLRAVLVLCLIQMKHNIQ